MIRSSTAAVKFQPGGGVVSGCKNAQRLIKSHDTRRQTPALVYEPGTTSTSVPVVASASPRSGME